MFEQLDRDATRTIRWLRAALKRIESSQDEIMTTLRELKDNTRQLGPAKVAYTPIEVASILGRRPFTVREWCRLGRIKARKRLSGRGDAKAWEISHDELERVRNHGLLPLPKRY